MLPNINGAYKGRARVQFHTLEKRPAQLQPQNKTQLCTQIHRIPYDSSADLGGKGDVDAPLCVLVLGVCALASSEGLLCWQTGRLGACEYICVWSLRGDDCWY